MYPLAASCSQDPFPINLIKPIKKPLMNQETKWACFLLGVETVKKQYSLTSIEKL